MTGKTEGELYEDRNALAVAYCDLLRRHHHLLAFTGNPRYADMRACWALPDAEDADAENWALLYGWIPEGQVSWHVPRELAESSNLPQKHAEWDGHDRPTKNKRLREFAGSADYSPR